MATPEEKKLMTFCDGLFRLAYDSQKDIRDADLRNWDYFNGKQWSTKSPIPEADRLVVNLFRNVILQSIAHQTSARPTVRVEPLLDTPECIQGADLYNRLDPIIYEELGLQSVFRNALFYAELGRSTCFLLRYYNPMLKYRREDPMGGYAIRALDPLTCFPDPACRSRDIQNDCQYFIVAERLPKPVIANYFPHKLEEIRQAGKASDNEENLIERVDGETDMGRDVNYFKLVSSTVTSAMNNNTWGSKDFDEENKVTMFRVWLRGDFQDMQFRFLAKDEDGNRDQLTQTVKTRWRQIVYIPGVLLFDGPSRFYDAELPLVRISNSPLPNALWGLDDNKHLIPVQDLYNELWSYYKINIRQQADPRGILSSSAKLDEPMVRKWFKGLVKYIMVMGSTGNAVFLDRPPQYGQDFFFGLEKLERKMEDIKAMPQILQGDKPSGVKSGNAIQTLTFNAMPRTSDKTQNFEVGIKETVEKVRLDWFTGQKPVIRRFVGGRIPIEIYPKDYLDLAVSTMVVPGSSMPNYSQQKVQEIASVATALQGLQPQFWPPILKSTGVPELRNLADSLAQVPPPVEGAGGQAQQPMQPGGAMQVPFQMPDGAAI